MNELIELFHRNFPFCVREESTLHSIIAQKTNTILQERDASGKLIGASVVDENNILFLCVDKEHRNRGIGSSLLTASEEHIRKSGFASVSAGAGKRYLMPGIPSAVPVTDETLRPDAVYDDLDPSGVPFFRNRGYVHSWDCNCFDMRMDLQDFSAVLFPCPDVRYRLAEPDDLERAAACTDDAQPGFTKYYRNPDYYTGTDPKRILIAEADGLVVGTLIVSLESEGAGLGSVGCTAVRHAYQGKKIASNLVILGTKMLRDAGMEKAFLGYTYTGLDRLYGFAGYRICVYYYMAAKQL